MKDILTILNEKSKTWLSPKHPLYEMPREKVIQYLAAMLIHKNMEPKEKQTKNFELLRLFSCGFSVRNKELQNVIKLSVEKEYVIDYIVKQIKEKGERYIFILDLYNISYSPTGYSKDALDAIALYGDMFCISSSQNTLLREFVTAANRKDVERCVNLFSNMLEFGMSLKMWDLKYYIPELSYTTVVDVNAIKEGQTVELQDHCEIRQELRVTKGIHLKIKNAVVNLSGPIVVDGGELEISNSEFYYKNGNMPALILIHSFTSVRMTESRFFCEHKCGGIRQSSGNLKLSQCTFCDVNVESAVTFFGNEMEATDCRFIDCYVSRAGAAISVQSGVAHIAYCQFEECYSEVGGAIYAKEPSIINGCTFRYCHARLFGHSIYYRGNARNKVLFSTFDKTKDSRLEVVQVIPKGEPFKDSILSISTLFEEPLYVRGNQELRIENAFLFLKEEGKIDGRLHMSNVGVKPYQFRGKDLLCAINARSIRLEQCELFGCKEYGLIRATGTPVEAVGCIFKDSNGGRAIYESLKLECKGCIFSNCIDGAIYGATVFLEECSFVSCYGDKGGALDLKKNRGTIRKCSFERCKAITSGGAISALGNYRIVDCQYSECYPQNVST